MNIKKVTVSLLAAAMLAGCGGGSAAASSTSAASGSKDIDEIKMQFVPSRDAETILKQTTDLPQLLIDKMKEKGYNIGKIDITVGAGSDYNVTGEALASGSVDIAWLPAGTYAQYSDETQVVLTATRDALSNDSTDPTTWNGDANKTTRVSGQPVTYYRGLIYAGPSEKGKALAAKVAAGEKLTWDDLNNASWAVASTTSSSGYIFPSLWLMQNYDGKKISDLANTTQTNYPTAFAEAAAGSVDVVLCYADGRMDYEQAWTTPTTEQDSTGIQGFGRSDSIWNEMSVIGVTDKIYNDTVAVTKANPDIDNDDFISAFQDAMIEIAGTDVGKKIFAVYSHTGYEKANDSDYDSIREGLKEVSGN